MFFQYSVEGVAGVKQPFESLSKLVKHLMDVSKNELNTSALLVTRLLPPSDYDKPELLLLCAPKEHFTKVKQEDQGPRVFAIDSLTAVAQDGSNILNGSFYRIVHSKRTADVTREVAVKLPHLPTQAHNTRFLRMCDNWFKLRDCDAVVMALGITLAPITVVMEWVTLGPLDIYLRVHKSELEQVDLLEAVTHLAKALFFLSQEGIQHNNIRCHSLLVSRHQDKQFLVKLSEPGDPVLDETSVHWIPMEHHSHPPTSKHDPSTDVWAFATTAWQVSRIYCYRILLSIKIALSECNPPKIFLLHFCYL